MIEIFIARNSESSGFRWLVLIHRREPIKVLEKCLSGVAGKPILAHLRTLMKRRRGFFRITAYLLLKA